ncbi:DNA helicase RecQ [Viridibacterium curvum]|uniref:DNA helicase RecQ n=1 Tax=Viridibacterium curvum TaxID=1101404 RepID=A0ABP9QDZ5_9RHOO
MHSPEAFVSSPEQDPALHVLRHTFGYAAFRGEQAAIVAHLQGGGDALVLMPTGGGKSLCYQIPSLLRPGCGLVVSPLIALMQDQVQALRQLGVKAAYLNSTLTPDEANEIERQLVDGSLELLYVAPERLLTPRFQNLLTRARIGLFAIDEAHCVSQWGHDFRPEYIQLSILHERFPDVPRVALTATADAATRQEIVERLALHDARVFLSSFDRPNIRYTVVEKDNPRKQLLRFIRANHDGDAGIVYCLSRKKVEETAAWLKSEGIRALPYHAGFDAAVRESHQTQFVRGDGIVMCATIAFGMGIDKPDVRFVAHLDLPKSLEAYYQETGRAGRDGLPSNAWMAYGLQDMVLLREMIEQSQAPDEIKRVERQKLDALLGYAEAPACRREVLLRYFGEASTPCGNCDMCLTPPQTFDASVAAQQALSTIYRSGQRYGAGHLIDILQGRETAKVTERGHQHLTTFGIGKSVSDAQWSSLLRQMVAQGFIGVNEHGGLILQEACRPVLRGETGFMARKVRESAPSGAASVRREIEFESDEARTLWAALRQCRRDLAEAQNVPAYVIFGDATLKQMLEKRPQTEDELYELSGVGDRKLAAYGEAFLAVLRTHQRRHA